MFSHSNKAAWFCSTLMFAIFVVSISSNFAATIPETAPFQVPSTNLRPPSRDISTSEVRVPKIDSGEEDYNNPGNNEVYGPVAAPAAENEQGLPSLDPTADFDGSESEINPVAAAAEGEAQDSETAKRNKRFLFDFYYYWRNPFFNLSFSKGRNLRNYPSFNNNNNNNYRRRYNNYYNNNRNNYPRGNYYNPHHHHHHHAQHWDWHWHL